MRRRGYTLIELLLVLAIVGILLGLAAPRISGLLDAVETDSATRRIVTAVATARAAAVFRSRVSLLTLAADSLVVRIVGKTDTAVVWVAAGPAAESVDLSGPTHVIRFAPNGLAQGVSNGTYQLSRGSAFRKVVVSRLGRVRILHQR